MASLTKETKTSNFPQGFKHGITIKGIPLHATHCGQVFWVDENASSPSNTKGSWENPCNSIENCMSLCVANRGDIIMVKPGHIENITAAADLTCDIAGVAIIGMGRGTKQAKITFDTGTGADVDVTADNVTISGMHINCNYAEVVAAFDVSGDYFCMENCRIRDGAANLEFLIFITLATGTDHFHFIGNDVMLFPGSSTTSLVYSEGLIAWPVVRNNIISMHAENAIFELGLSSTTGVPIFANNVMANWDNSGVVVDISANSTSLFANEEYANAQNNTEMASDGAESYFLNCKGTDAVAVSSRTVPRVTAAI